MRNVVGNSFHNGQAPVGRLSYFFILRKEDRMKPLSTMLAVVCLLTMVSAAVFAQAVGDYRSTGNGNWNTATTWERWNGSAWAVTGTPPNGSEHITIQVGDTVTVDVAVTISDTLKNQGAIEDSTNLTIADGGVFQHDQDAGTLPLATWESGSTLLITGTVGVAPDDRNQNFHHIEFNTPGMLANLHMALDSVTIGGDIRVVNTGAARWYITSALAGDTNTVWIMGDIIMENGQFSSNGTSNGCHIQVYHYGNILVTGGNFSVSRGSQGSGSGSTRWYLYGDSFSMSNATTQNSNLANAWFIFAKQGVQTLTLGEGNTLSSFPIVVDSGTTLDMGVSKLRGSGRFELNAGSGLATGEQGGLDSAVVVTSGEISVAYFDTLAQYIFNGTAGNQVTGTTLPTSVHTVVAENPDTVILSQETTIFGPLILRAGIFDNTIEFDLGGTGWILFQGGELRFGVPVAVERAETVPVEFFVDQNYPNPFNPSTTIIYGLPEQGFVTAKVYNLLGQEVATLFEGVQVAGIHELVFDASRLTSGIYLYRIQANGVHTVRQMVLLK